MTMLERMARALWFDYVNQQGYPNGLPTWDEMPESDFNKVTMRSQARAAVEAMRAPRPELLLPSTKIKRMNGAVGISTNEWHVTLNAILNEKPSD